MASNKRKSYFIESSFQGKFIFHFLGLMLVGALLFSLILSMTTAETWGIIYDTHEAFPGSTPFILIKELVKANWILILLGGLMVAILAVLYSHRIAGPLYKFEMVLEDMQNGILDPNCKLRNKDDGQAVMGQLQRTNRFIADKVNELRSITDNLRETSKSEGHSQEAIANATGKLEAIVDSFKIRE